MRMPSSPFQTAAPAAATEPARPQPRNGSFRGRACPLCSGVTERVSRHFIDRLLSLFMPVSRYRCRSSSCTWEGALRPRSSQAPAKTPSPRRRRPMLEASRLAGSAAGTLKSRAGGD